MRMGGGMISFMAMELFILKDKAYLSAPLAQKLIVQWWNFSCGQVLWKVSIMPFSYFPLMHKLLSKAGY